MADKYNRVLARAGARRLTEEVVAQVGGVGTPILFTHALPPQNFDGKILQTPCFHLEL